MESTVEYGSFFQAANVLKRPIVSHYPTGLNPNIEADLSRTIFPLESSKMSECHILWTYLNRIDGVPNHFVPLLPMSTPAPGDYTIHIYDMSEDDIDTTDREETTVLSPVTVPVEDNDVEITVQSPVGAPMEMSDLESAVQSPAGAPVEDSDVETAVQSCRGSS